GKSIFCRSCRSSGYCRSPKGVSARARWLSEMARMLVWLTLAAATAWLLWYMTTAPGVSYSGPLKPLTGEEAQLAEKLRRHGNAIASREHNQFRFAELEASARYIERTFEGYGYSVDTHRIATPAGGRSDAPG